MPYVECPECGLRVNTAIAFIGESCPRCLARHRRRISLEATSTRQRFERARKLAEIELREAGLTPDAQQP